MKGRAWIIAGAVALSACASAPQPARPFEDPAVQKLFALQTPQYFATLRLANTIALTCPRYSYDTALDFLLKDKRNEVGRGTLSAVGLGNAIDLEQDVTDRSFMAKHGVALVGDDLCPAADVERAEGTALSAILVPVQ